MRLPCRAGTAVFLPSAGAASAEPVPRACRCAIRSCRRRVDARSLKCSAKCRDSEDRGDRDDLVRASPVPTARLGLSGAA